MSKHYKDYEALIKAEDDFVQKNYGINWTKNDMIEFADFVKAQVPKNAFSDRESTEDYFELWLESKK